VNNGRGEAITEPSGKGAFAEAMRELIAQLTPVPDGLLLARTPARGNVQPAHARTRARHLRLVRA
jgi:hypothetical protein